MKNLIVIETGGMKGRKKEISRDELHQRLQSGFGVENIHSEYGMTELFSQAYAIKDGKFKNPPWMKTFIRDINNPLFVSKKGKGAINIIDLANETFMCIYCYGRFGMKFLKVININHWKND